MVSEPGFIKLRSSQKLLNTYIDELQEVLDIKLSMLENAKLGDFQRLEKEFAERKANVLKKKEYILERISEKGIHVVNGFIIALLEGAGDSQELPGYRELDVDGSVFAQAEYKRTVANLLED